MPAVSSGDIVQIPLNVENKAVLYVDRQQILMLKYSNCRNSTQIPT